MKKLIYLSLIIALLSNCLSNNKAAVTDSGKTSTNGTSQQLIKKFTPIINGLWIKADYIEKIRQSKSPLAAEDLVGIITAIAISTDTIRGDSIIAAVDYGNHEGGNVTIKFKPGKAVSSIVANDNDLTYRVEHGDTVLLIEQTISEGKKKQFVKYVKNKNTNDINSDVDRVVNKSLVAGNYYMTDSTGTASKVSFDANGKITGFLSFNHYAINIDLNDDPMDNLNEIFFSRAKKMTSSIGYTYKIADDTLKLYSMRANADSTEDILDKLKYTLVRSK